MMPQTSAKLQKSGSIFLTPTNGRVRGMLFYLVFALSGVAVAQEPLSIDLEPIEVSAPSVTAGCDLGWGFCGRAPEEGEEARAEDPPQVRAASPGGLGQQLSLESNLNVNSSGQPGGRASVIGLGRSAEETDVRTLGVSLNPPQGGGFDLSSFPSLFWANALSSVGTPMGGGAAFRDPRAPSGVFELMPWTAAAVLQPVSSGSTYSLMQTGSSQSVFESAVGFTAADRSLATWAGWTSGGTVGGPSAAISYLSRPSPQNGGSWDAHLLFADLASDSPGSQAFPTPGATQRSQRIVPVLGWQGSSFLATRLRIRGFADIGKIDYQAPSLTYSSVDRSSRLGISVSSEPLQLDALRVGLSIERSQLQQTGYSDFPEWTGVVWSGKSFRWAEGLWIEPRLQWFWVSQLASRGGPQADLRLQKALDGVFERVHFSVGSAIRAPSLLNRVYRSPFFNGNPDLEAERTWSARAGLDGDDWKIATFAELRENALVTTGVLQPYNSGSAYLGGIEFDWTQALGENKRWMIHQSLRWTASRVDALSSRFPLVPPWSGQGGVRWRGGRSWESGVSYRAVSSFSSGLGSDLPGFGIWNFETNWNSVAFAQAWRVSIRVENLLGQPASWIPDYPLPGRVFSIALSSELE